MSVVFTNLLIFNRDFIYGKSQKSQGAKSGLLGGLTHLADVMLCQKKPARELKNGQAHCGDEADLLARSL